MGIRTTMAVLVTATTLTAHAGTAHAGVVDFESFNLGGGSYVPLQSGVQLPSKGSPGTVVTVYGAVELRVYDLVKFGGGAITGQGLISWTWPAGSNPDGLTFRFSRPVNAVSLDAGDWLSDDDGKLELDAFNCQGEPVAHTEAPWDINRQPPFTRLAVQAEAICSVVYRSGGQYPGSTFVDNLRFESTRGVPRRTQP